MVLEFVQQIKNTEEKSKELYKKSQATAKEIVENAKLNSEKILSDVKIEAKAEKTRLIEEAVRMAKDEILSAQKANEHVVNKIKEIAMQNEKKAVKFIIEKITEK